MGKKNKKKRKEKKIKELKTKSVREKEINTIKLQLGIYGIPLDINGIKELFK